MKSIINERNFINNDKSLNYKIIFLILNYINSVRYLDRNLFFK